jgi:hypothetical protein
MPNPILLNSDFRNSPLPKGEVYVNLPYDAAAEAQKRTYVKPVCERLQTEYISLLSSLTDKEDIVVSIFLSNGLEILVSEFDYDGTNLLIVKGLNSKSQEVTAFVHQSSLQVVFSKVPKGISEPRREIGFLLPKTE